jgi:hypothetical protein
MALGRVPVIISDAWIEPEGVDWTACSVRISEQDIERLPDLLSKVESDWKELAANARLTYDRLFSTTSLFNWLGDQMQVLLDRRAQRGTRVCPAAIANYIGLVEEGLHAVKVFRRMLQSRSHRPLQR